MASQEFLPIPPPDGIPGMPGSDVCHLVYKATDQSNTSEDWAAIIDITDKVKVSPDRQKMAVKTLIDRLQLKNANVILYSMVLADSLVKNLPNVRRDFASRPFLDAVVKKLNDKTLHATLKNRILQILGEWNDSMRSDPQLGYMHDVYNNLKAQGHQFPQSAQHKPPVPPPSSQSSAKASKSLEEREEEELQLALALSLSELESKRPPTPQPQRFIDNGPAPPPMGSIQQAPPEPERTHLFQVRALYDFAGDASQGELSLLKGDIVAVTDTSFKDWWKGECKGRSGIFPQNYTERVKEAPKEDPQLEEQVMQASVYVDRFLEILAKVDPKRENLSENEELQDAYREMLLIRPKLVKLIELYAAKKEELLELNDVFSKAQASYQRLIDSTISQHRRPAGYNPQYPAQSYYQ